MHRAGVQHAGPQTMAAGRLLGHYTPLEGDVVVEGIEPAALGRSLR